MSFYMKRSLEIAEKGRFTVSPNPMVGAVFVRDHHIIAQGYHHCAGGPHAERSIDRDVNLEGSTLYINLEPCCHYGRTPPCVDFLIQSRIKSAHIACIDPNPVVAGRSIQKLKDAGIEVVLGEMQEEAERLNEIFFYYMRHKRPYVIAKWAMTMDGKMATNTGNSKWITSEDAREHAHYIRNSVDAILIGTRTALYDDPLLDVRVDVNPRKNPQRFVIDQYGNLPLHLRLFQNNPFNTCVITTLLNKNVAHLEKQGVKLMILEEDQWNPNQMLLSMGNVSSVLIEGGGATLSYFSDYIQKFYCYIAPQIIGDGLSPFSKTIAIDSMSHAKKARFYEVKTLKKDVVLIGNFD
jgi:diaminohydroxyphosphoribosylaminopyrimidine deaminase/5-amino-6-(5-phosphoribosylamino)uracil reductase